MPDFNEPKCTIKDQKNIFIIDGQIPNQVVRYAKITQIIDDTAIVKCIPGGGIAICKLTDLFAARYDAEQTIKMNLEVKQQNYTAEIEDVDSLVRFMFTHDINHNGNDCIAREIAIMRAHQLGINLQDIVK